MKNASDFIPTISEVLIEDALGNLSVQIDFDFSTETIRQLKFAGTLKEYFFDDLNFLETHLENKRPYDFAKILKDKNLSLVIAQGMQNLFNEYLGVVPVGSANDLLCVCFGLTKRELQKLCQANAITFGEMMATTKATTGCGSCLSAVQKIYHENAYLKAPIENASPFPAFKEWTYAETLIMIDDLRIQFLQAENLAEDTFEIVSSKAWQLELAGKTKISSELKKHFSLYVFSRTGLLISFFD